MNQSATQVTQVLEAYKEAVLHKDLNAYMALYSEDAEIFDMWGPTWIHKTKEAWLESTRNWFDNLGEERVLVEIENLQVQQTSEMAYATAFIKYSAINPEGKTLRWLENRMSCILAPKNGTWKIIHQHTSAPINHTNLQASLQRTTQL